MRVPISYALTYPERAATPVDELDFSEGLSLEFEPPDLETFPLLALPAGCGRVAAAPIRAPTTPRTKLPCPRSSRGGCLLGIAGVVQETLDGVEGAPAGDLDELVKADAEARRAGRKRCRSTRHVNVFVAILGLGLLVLVHEAGHFFTARAVSMTPRRFYIGFPPPIVSSGARESSTSSGTIRSAAT